ncbi:MAG: sensor histidine kinase KdpD [Anaerostipes sp.]|nr:sensor histidine kinase KdpD [Anaerostipes sp.]
MEIQRPKPEEILEHIQSEQEKITKGKLKIFFGYAAGVGKTYAMLKEASEKKAKGIDIVCGYIEPHMRPDTMQLIEGMEVIPVKQVKHQQMILEEMDLDGILRRKPQIVLVDEFAHTNAAGSRHEKRYQDVKELLYAGIDVYTTVNVQHIESFCDIVASITEIRVKERIPDRVFDLADEVQLVDVEPSVLIHRLKEGKIYKIPQAKKALQHFFTEEKLTALRELALRRTVVRINWQSEKAKKRSGHEYFTEEKIMVGISASPSSERSIRTAARLAQAFDGVFIGLYVEPPDFENLGQEDQKRLESNIRLAQQLGAKIETICGEDIPFIMAEYARTSGISKLVIGRSNVKRRFIPRATFVERLTMLAPDLDIYVIPDGPASYRSKISRRETIEKVSWKDIVKSLGILAIATIISLCFYYMGFTEANIIIVYILGVMISGITISNRMITFCLSIFSVIIFNFLFTEPRFSLQAYDSGYPVTFFITFLAALISSNLALKMKLQAKELAKVAYRTKVILDTNQLLQDEKDMDGIGKIISDQLSKLLNRDIVFYKAENNVLLEPEVTLTQETSNGDVYVTNSEQAVAAWVYKNRKRAGASTGTFGNAQCYYLAIRNEKEVYGVIAIAMKSKDSLAAFESNLLFAVLSEAAAAMERETLRHSEEKATEQANSEKLRANLLRSISHDLRTPLTSISGNADMLLRNEFDEESRRKICTDMYDDSMWLINLVENLLSVTRIEDGTMAIKMHAEMLEDIIEEALKHINRKSTKYHIELMMEDEMQLVKVDSRLIVQVIINLVDNAIKYTPVGSSILIQTRKTSGMVSVEVSDNGPGIDVEDKEKIFDMFYTSNAAVADSSRSLGLGLALCKSIVSAHGGTIDVVDNTPSGAIFRFTLIPEEVTIHE